MSNKTDVVLEKLVEAQMNERCKEREEMIGFFMEPID